MTRWSLNGTCLANKETIGENESFESLGACASESHLVANG